MKKVIKPSVKILIADNDKDFLETRRDFLERAGYTVIPALSPAEAHKQLKEMNPDLVILDIRLVNDDDEKDYSGIELAKEISRSVPVLLLTGYPSLEYACQVLKPQLDGLPIAYDFIVKQEGPEAMLTAVKRTLEVAKGRVLSPQPMDKIIQGGQLRLFFSWTLTTVFEVFPRIIGRAILDLFGREKASDSTSILLGYFIIFITILVLQGVVNMNTLVDWFVEVWRFFFPK